MNSQQAPFIICFKCCVNILLFTTDKRLYHKVFYEINSGLFDTQTAYRPNEITQYMYTDVPYEFSNQSVISANKCYDKCLRFK